MSYPALAAPLKLAGMTLNNRFVMTAMGSNFAEPDGRCGEKLKAYYQARAAGGCGLIIVETTSIAYPSGCSMPNMVGVSGEQFLPDLADLAARVQAHGCKIGLQLNHSGKVSQEDVAAGRPLLVPSLPKKSSNDMMPLPIAMDPQILDSPALYFQLTNLLDKNSQSQNMTKIES